MEYYLSWLWRFLSPCLVVFSSCSTEVCAGSLRWVAELGLWVQLTVWWITLHDLSRMFCLVDPQQTNCQSHFCIVLLSWLQLNKGYVCMLKNESSFKTPSGSFRLEQSLHVDFFSLDIDQCTRCHILSQWLYFLFKVLLIWVQLWLLRGLDSNCHWSCCRRADVFATSRRDETKICAVWKFISQKGLPQWVSPSASFSPGMFSHN